MFFCFAIRFHNCSAVLLGSDTLEILLYWQGYVTCGTSLYSGVLFIWSVPYVSERKSVYGLFITFLPSDALWCSPDLFRHCDTDVIAPKFWFKFFIRVEDDFGCLLINYSWYYLNAATATGSVVALITSDALVKGLDGIQVNNHRSIHYKNNIVAHVHTVHTLRKYNSVKVSSPGIFQPNGEVLKWVAEFTVPRIQTEERNNICQSYTSWTSKEFH